MSKRNLDSLFKSKLANAEVEVRPEAWHHLKDRMDRKKGLVVLPYLYAAVLTGVLFSIGLFFYQHREDWNGTNRAELAALDTVQKEKTGMETARLEQSKSDTSATVPIDKTLKEEKNKPKAPLRSDRYSKSYLATQKFKSPTQEESVHETDPMQQQLALQTTTVPADTNTSIPVETSPAQPTMGISVTLALTNVQATDATVETKPLKKLWQQLKALKKGEEVSLKEIRQTGQQLIAGIQESDSE